MAPSLQKRPSYLSNERKIEAVDLRLRERHFDWETSIGWKEFFLFFGWPISVFASVTRQQPLPHPSLTPALPPPPTDSRQYIFWEEEEGLCRHLPIIAGLFCRIKSLWQDMP